jgi:hypothetical protein
MTSSRPTIPLAQEFARAFVLLGLAVLGIFVVLPGLLALAAAAGG